MTLALLLPLGGCVYYNTFYNAKKRYEEAEWKRLEAEADLKNRGLKNVYRNLYLAVIRKASSILQFHPDSDWVDDSLILIGKSYYWREEYSQAIQKFDELQDNFPESQFVNESIYWESLALWGREETTSARRLLDGLGQNEGKFAWHARLALAELETEEGNVDSAVDLYQSLVEKLEEDDLRARVWRGLGDAHFDRGNLADALGAYKQVLRSDPDNATSFETRSRIGAVHERQGNLDEAAATYDRMAKVKRFVLYEPRIRLLQAKVIGLRGELEGAITAYEDIIEQNDRTDYAAEAHYQIGLIEHKIRHDNEAAMERFKQAQQARGGADAALLAREMENNLFQLDRFKKRAEKHGQRGLEALFDLAELYLFNLSSVDSALITYQRALSRAEADSVEEMRALAPKALYAIGVITADSLRNQGKATEMFKRLVEGYPVNPYAVEARNRLASQRSDDLLAEARYIEAEELKREGQAGEEVVAVLEQIAGEYPNSLFAPKALFAVGWTYENDLEDPLSAADRYEDLIERYPLTEFALLAKQKLKRGDLKDAIRAAKKKQEEKPPEAEDASPEATTKEPDGAQAESPVEEPASKGVDPASGTSPDETASEPSSPSDGSVSYESSEVDDPPTVRSSPEPPSIEDLEGLRPVANLRVLVNEAGKVAVVVVVEAHEKLKDAAIASAKEHTFNPGKRRGTLVKVWVPLTISFVTTAG